MCAALCGVGQPADLFDSGASGSLPRETSSLFAEGPLVVAPEKRGGQVWRETEIRLAKTCHPSSNFPQRNLCNTRTLQIALYCKLIVVLSAFCICPESVLRLDHLALQGRHLRRPGEEESDVDIEGFEDEDDGKPKTPAPVRTDLLKGEVVDVRFNYFDCD